MGVKVGYARTSTADQTAGLEDQERILKAQGCDRIYSEHISAVAMKRPELDACLGYVREGDTLVTTKLDRLARSTAHMLQIVEYLKGRGVTLHIMDMGIDTSTPTGELFITFMAGMAQFERTLMLERQRVGIAAAKADGKYKGGRPKLDPEKVAFARREIAKGRSKVEVSEILGISRVTLYRALKEGVG